MPAGRGFVVQSWSRLSIYGSDAEVNYRKQRVDKTSSRPRGEGKFELCNDTEEPVKALLTFKYWKRNCEHCASTQSVYHFPGMRISSYQRLLNNVNLPTLRRSVNMLLPTHLWNKILHCNTFGKSGFVLRQYVHELKMAINLKRCHCWQMLSKQCLEYVGDIVVWRSCW